ncbi:hypothetical protein Poly30_25480 [Planctomycetes bacterium Poly30]|uniref:Uncharacterized protein n=1 Tax=Saltatorellus ferox TaxID=2528018 RepID=A0A518ESG0_9BACT|nr:hypothetical protein Poly30_25480 [Planctomycetes bacterium Poly30]
METASPLIGVVASPQRVEAQLVSVTPFGRMRSAGRRVVEDVDGPMDFLPLTVERQLAGSTAAGNEARAGQAWVETVANSIAKLTFGLRGGKPRVGLCLEARLGPRGREVEAAEGGARVKDFVADLEQALRGRNIDLASPIGRALTPGEACALGEMHSALGGLAGVPDAVALIWESDVHWARVARGRIVQTATEPHGGRLDLGLRALDERFCLPGDRSKRLFVAARESDPRARDLLCASALALGQEAARRLLDWPVPDDRHHPNPAPPPSRLLLGGLVGRLSSDSRLRGVLLDPFEEGLARGLHDRDDAARIRGLIVASEQPEGSGLHEYILPPGLIQVSQEDSAAVIGAASTVAPSAQTRP